MPIRNQHWYNINAGIAYPVDESASAVSDSGDKLPSNLLTDINLRWPRELGDYAFLSSISVSSKLVTATIQVADSLDSTSFSPLAVISVVLPATQGRMYALRPQVIGVGGWIVFGSGLTDKTYQGRFSSPRQGLLAPRAARPFRSLPVSSVAVADARSKLTGTVLLRATAPLAINKAQRDIGGILRDCIVVGLRNDAAKADDAATQALGLSRESVFKQFAGPCAGRPESGTCGTPEPIEFINAVGPDCNGRITLQFDGCAEITKVGDSAVAVDCSLGLSAACLAKYVPDESGFLPGEYVPAVIPPFVPPEVVTPDTSSESSEAFAELPHLDCFRDGDTNAFSVKTGLWTFVADSSPDSPCSIVSASLSESDTGMVYATATAAMRNTSVWDGNDTSTVYRKVSTDVKLIRGPAGAKQNAHLVLNYRPHASIPELSVYYTVALDYDEQEFRIGRFNGTTFSQLVPVSVHGLMLDTWYRIEATITPGPTTTQTRISVRVTSVETPGDVDVTINVNVSNYRPSDGLFGLGSDRAVARFGHFLVEAV